jgi:hypothetical protein
MTVGEFAGYLASLLVFVTFYMRTMVPLRVVGILSIIAFLAYAMIEHLVPILILHGALLPLNLFRLHEILKLVGEIKDAKAGDLSMDALLPFMTRRRFKPCSARARPRTRCSTSAKASSGSTRSARGSARVRCSARSACSRPAGSTPPRRYARRMASCCG